MYKKIRCKSFVNLSKFGDYTGYSCNPYKGCTHACVYCYAKAEKYRPNDFDSLVQARVNAPQVLRRQLPRLKKGVVHLGSACDPYQFIEKELGLTKKVIQVLNEYKFPVGVLTKSDLVIRDLDLFTESIWSEVGFTITTTDKKLSALLEPGAPSPKKRLKALRKLSDAGIHTGVWLMPIVPFLEDSDENIESVISAAKENGAEYVMHSTMTMKDWQAKEFLSFIKKEFPELTKKYKSIYAGYRYSPIPEYTEKIKARTTHYRKKYGLPFYGPQWNPKETTLQTKLSC